MLVYQRVIHFTGKDPNQSCCSDLEKNFKGGLQDNVAGLPGILRSVAANAGAVP